MNPNRLRQLPAGIKDYLFEEAEHRRSVENRIRETFALVNYSEIITPTLEYLNVFRAAGRNGSHKKIYRFLDRDGNLMALRSDFTAQIARIIASKSAAIDFPARVFYSGKIFRFEELHAGLNREPWQAGFELLGETDIDGDIEALQNVIQVLRALDLNEFQVNIGTIEFFNGIVGEAGLQDQQLEEIKYLIGNQDADGLAHTLKKMTLPDSTRSALQNLINLHGGGEILNQAKKIATNDRSRQSIAKLAAIYERLEKLNLTENIIIDLSEIQGLGYYSGTIMKAFVRGVGYEVGSGGRYDNLLSQFGFDCPAVGFSFDVDRLIEGLSHI